MKYRRKIENSEEIRLSPAELDMPVPAELFIIGAGGFLHDIMALIKEYPEFRTAAILDPEPSLKGQLINGIPVIGWLGDLPGGNTSAVVGVPSIAGAFDRESVFQILLKQGVHLPILQSRASKCATDVVLRRATLVFPGAMVHTGATIGMNCLIGAGSVTGSGVELDDHFVMMPNEKLLSGRCRKASKIQVNNLSTTLAAESDTIQDIIQKINRSRMEIVIITDKNEAIVGTVTDGDIRRGILAGIGMHQPISTIMNKNPITVPIGTSYSRMFEIMKNKSIRQLPVVDTNNKPVSLEIIDSVLDRMEGQGAIVMAGGLGARLRPLTLDTPKPMLNVGGKPILDHILSGLHESGVQDVIISVNYLGGQIKQYVGDGRDHSLNVEYLNEKDRLGTAGALSLLRPRPRRPFLVINGDLLIKMDFSRILRFQKKHAHDIVMCVQKRRIDVPYGVVEIDKGNVVSLREKPAYEHFINAGIYALEPSCINLIPRNRFFDMPDLINVVLSSGGSVGAFPIIEYWRDIGTPEDLAGASLEHLKSETNVTQATQSIIEAGL